MIDNGHNMPKPKCKPLQFKRGTARAFLKANPILLKGEPAYEWDTKKLKVGDGCTRYVKLPYIGDHSKPEDGKSAYQIWIEAGNTGTIDDFLESLKGEKGDKGDDGKSAYQIWLDEGNIGTEQDFLDSLQWESVFIAWREERLRRGEPATLELFVQNMTTSSWGRIEEPY